MPFPKTDLTKKLRPLAKHSLARNTGFVLLAKPGRRACDAAFTPPVRRLVSHYRAVAC